MSAPNQYRGGPKQALQQVIPLGTSGVTTLTKALFVAPLDLKVNAIKFYGQADVTATALTAEVFARTLAGATGNTLLAAETNVKFAEGAGKAGVAGTLTATTAHRSLLAGQLLEVTVTADTCSAGPGDFVVVVEYEPR
jgi:hypothetical protein